MSTEFLFYDYETFGIRPRRDRITQFAAIRTDSEFNIIDEPINIYCKQYDDYIPSPEAILITGITVEECNTQGKDEREFAQKIYTEFMKPNTCVLGYNSIRFDDEMTRYLFYRNFYDPYEYTWRNGNSRWDVLDLVRGIYALRSEGIIWPQDKEGKTVLKLEEITKANGLEHEHAHDALSDVYATVAVLKLIREKQPRFFDYFFKHRRARDLLPLIENNFWQPLVHVSGMFGEVNGYLSLVTPVSMHPWNKNAVIAIDLRGDIEELLKYDADEIREAMYTVTADLTEGRSRVPLKLIHLNKCPVIAPQNTLKDVDNLFGLDIRLALDKLQMLKQHQTEIEKKLRVVCSPTTAPSYDEEPILYRVESMLYDGFFSSEDKKIMGYFPSLSKEDFVKVSLEFNDARIAPLLFLYRAKNFPETLSKEEMIEWEQYCLYKKEKSLPSLYQEYLTLSEHYKDDPSKIELLENWSGRYLAYD